MGQQVKIVFLELNVPQMEGLEWLKIIRGQPCFTEVSVAVLTSSREQSAQDRAAPAGC